MFLQKNLLKLRVSETLSLWEIFFAQRPCWMSILFISHDISIIRYASTRVAVMYLGNIVEMGETDTIIHHPMHPYTQVLISNCASIDLDEKKEPIRIEGEPPSPVNFASFGTPATTVTVSFSGSSRRMTWLLLSTM